MTGLSLRVCNCAALSVTVAVCIPPLVWAESPLARDTINSAIIALRILYFLSFLAQSFVSVPSSAVPIRCRAADFLLLT